MEIAANRIRMLGLSLALIGTLLLVLACVSVSAASPWGKLNRFSLTSHLELKNLYFGPQFAAGTDGSYYILDSPSEGEFRLQRFKEGNVEATTQFTPLTKAEKEGAREGAGHEGVGATLAVDSSGNRVYVLMHYERRAQSKKEEKEEEETGKPVFPLDASMTAAGSLYGFEYEAGHLTPIKEKENEAKTGKEPAPVLSRTAFAAVGEAPKEALLDPRGMAVEPATGDLVVTGNQDQEENKKVREGKPKQCRPAAQFVAIAPNAKGGLKGATASLGSRYVDNNAKSESTILHTNGEEGGCGEAEAEEAEEQAPLSPAFAPDGSLLVLYDNENEGIGQIWEMTPALTKSQIEEPKEETAAPQELYNSESLENVLEVESAAEQGDVMMSLIGESATDGTIYLDEKGRNGLDNYISGESTPLVLHYHRAPGGQPSVSEVGWTGGQTVNSDLGPQECTVHIPQSGSVELAGLGSGKYLGFTTYNEDEAGKPVPRAEVVEFGEGGSTSGCPTPAVTTPVQSFAGKETRSLFAGTEKVTISSYLNRIESGVVKFPALANAKSVEWTIKFTGPKGEKEEKQLPAVQFPIGGEDPLKVSYAFEHVGTYEIIDTVHTDDLADEVVRPAAPDTVKVVAKELSVKIGVPNPRSIRAHEQEAEFTATVEDTTVAPGTQLTVASVTWQLGEEAPVVLGEQQLENGGKLTLKHSLGRCKTTNCKVSVTVQEKGGEAFVGHSEQAEITVTEDLAEQAAREAQEAKERQQAKEQQEARERQEAAEREAAAKHKAEEEAAAKKAAEEAAAHKKAEEEAAAKKHKEEEEKTKKSPPPPPTRAQLLAKALKQCKKEKPRSKQMRCEAAAKKKYGPKKKGKKKK